MKRPMPLPVTLTDYILLDQMGYEVLHKDGKPVKVVPKSERCSLSISASTEETIEEIKHAFKRLTRKLKTKLPVESEHNAR